MVRDVRRENGKLRLVLRSRKVVSRIAEFEMASSASTSLMAFNGQLFGSRKRVALYDYVFDEEQTRALREARELAVRSGLVLEVTDLTRLGILRRMLRLGLSRASRDDLTRYLASPSLGSEKLGNGGPTSSPACRL